MKIKISQSGVKKNRVHLAKDFWKMRTATRRNRRNRNVRIGGILMKLQIVDKPH